MANFKYRRACPECGSRDNVAVYDDDSYFCFSYCGYKSVSQEWIEQYGDKPKNKIRTTSNTTTTKDKSMKEQQDISIKPSGKPALTQEENAEIKSFTSIKGSGYRSISDDTYKAFGVRHAYAEETGEVIEQYYPCTQEGQLVGYKIREEPKNFRAIGRVGAEVELFMQFKFNRGGKYILLTEGEADSLAAYQMLKEYNTSKGNDFETAVVSSTVGSGGSIKQIASQYKFLDSFDNIIISYDNDKAGREATEKLIAYLPKGKVKVMQMRYKDANEYLMKDEQRSFVSDFYNAKRQVPVGVLPSDQLYDRILEQSAISKVPFPPFMGKLNELFVGGMPLGHIINVAADTGIGKTTLVNEMIYYWIFNSPHKIGVVSMELDAGQYGEVLLSRHLSKKIALIESQDEKMKFLTSDKIREKGYELMVDHNGDSRFFLLDNRDGSIEEIQDTIEELVVVCGAKVIVLDPLQDILDGLSNEEQATFMKWAKGFIKSHGITFVFINHMRKSEDGADNEQNIMGSSTIIKSASANILLKRDKMSDDAIIRNTTQIRVPKNRIYGLTGPAGAAYYDNDTHTLYNLDDYLDEHGITKDF